MKFTMLRLERSGSWVACLEQFWSEYSYFHQHRCRCVFFFLLTTPVLFTVLGNVIAFWCQIRNVNTYGSLLKRLHEVMLDVAKKEASSPYEEKRQNGVIDDAWWPPDCREMLRDTGLETILSSFTSVSSFIRLELAGRDQPPEQIVNYDVYCRAHSRLCGLGGKGWGLLRRPPSSPHSIFPSGWFGV